MPAANGHTALDETAALALLRTAFPGGWRFWRDGDRWWAAPPRDFWADYRDPVDEADPIRLARLAGEVVAWEAPTETYAPHFSSCAEVAREIHSPHL